MPRVIKPRPVTRKQGRDDAAAIAESTSAPKLKRARLSEPQRTAQNASRSTSNSQMTAEAGSRTRTRDVKKQTAVSKSPTTRSSRSQEATKKVTAPQGRANTASTAKGSPLSNAQVVEGLKAKKLAESSSKATAQKKTLSERRAVSKKGRATTRQQKQPRSKAHPSPAQAREVARSPDNDEVSTEAAKPRRKRKRATTPEEAETAIIDPTSQTMGALVKRDRLGKKSNREKAMEEIDWADIKRRRKEEKANALAALHEGRSGRQEQTSEQEVNERLDQAMQEPQPGRTAPQMILVNGVYIIPDKTTIAARPDPTHRAGDDGAPLEEVEENELTARVNSQSWMHNNARDPIEALATMGGTGQWDAESTNLFYDGLRMFGTDFTMISKMFPGRTRRNVKNKFTREEREHPERITAALLGEHVTMDLERYAEMTGKDQDYYKDPKDLELELKQAEELQKEEIEREKLEQREAQQKKQEAEKAKLEAKRKRKEARNNNQKEWQTRPLSIAHGDGEELTNGEPPPEGGLVEEEEDMGAAGDGGGMDEN